MMNSLGVRERRVAHTVTESVFSRALVTYHTHQCDTWFYRLVFCKQIVIHKNPCYEPASSSPTSTDVPLTSILVYVIDEDGKFNAAMTKNMPSLYKVTNTLFPVKVS